MTAIVEAPQEPQQLPKRPVLKIVKPEDAAVAKQTANILLYGQPKVGKSTAAASAPPRILYVNCDLPNAMRFPRERYGANLDEVNPESLQDLMDVALALKHDLMAGKCEWETVVTDPMHDLYRILHEDLSKRSVRPSLPVLGDAQVHIERYARQLCRLPINTVFVAHETATKNEETGGFETIPFMGTTNDRPAGKLMGMVDVIGYCGIISESNTEDENEQHGERYAAQLKAANKRRAGSRFDMLGKVRSLDLAEWFHLINPPTQEAPKQVSKGASK